MHITEVVVRLWLGHRVSPEGGHSCLSLIKKNPHSGDSQASYAKNQIDVASASCGGGLSFLFFLCGGFWCLIILFYLTCQAVSFDCLFNNSPRMFSCRKF